MDRLYLTVSAAQDGRTVYSLLRRELSMADGQISSAKFRPDGILKNGARVRVRDIARAGDVISVSIADRGRNAAAPLALDIPILWEDAYLIVLEKPAGVSVYGDGTQNIAGFFAYKWGENAVFHPVNRLDVGTTGIMVAARDGYTHDRLRRLLHTDDFRREYLAVAEGAVTPPSGVIELPISRGPVSGARRAVEIGGLPSRTGYETLAARRGLTLLRLRLYTGRTHQIRLHLSAIGFPLAGDRLYGARGAEPGRPALHSHRLVLRHPVTGRTLDIVSPLPEDMARLLRD